jgi:hypothetical protein
MSTLSNNAEKVLNIYLNEKSVGVMVVIEKTVFRKTTNTKQLAHHCFYTGILFHWSVKNYYFMRVR